MKSTLTRLILVFIPFAFFVSKVFPQAIPAQNFGVHPRAYTERKSFWTEFNLSGSISNNNRWQYQIDYQYRRAADASFVQGGSSANIFNEPQQQVFRPWIHYWLIKDVFRLSLSPLGYWITWTPAAESAMFPTQVGDTSGQTVYPEFRITPQVTSIHTLGRVQFIQRFRYEFRFVGERKPASNNLSDFGKGYNFAPTNIEDQSAAKDWYGNNHLGRLRWQTRLQIPLNNSTVKDKTWYINTWDELFLSLGHHTKNNKILNQNRLVALLGYRFNGDVPIKIEGGVTFQTILQYNLDVPQSNPTVSYQSNNIENNTAFTIYVIFDQFHKLFKKSKAE
jgi:hypothetical protein